MYAIIESGGHQFKVEAGETVQVNKIDSPVGSEVTLDKVVLVADHDKMKLGAPYVPAARVLATVTRQDRAKKVIVFKKRRKKGYKKTQGHRQYITDLKIKEILI